MRIFVEVIPFLAWAIAIIFFGVTAHRTPNLLVITGFLLAALTVFFNWSLFSVTPLEAFYGLITAFVVFLPLFIFRLIGGADLKVFTVLGSWCGIHGLAVIWIAATSGVLILFLVAYANAVMRNGLPFRNPSDVKTKISSVQTAHIAKHGSFVPYTVLLCAAALISFGLRVVKKY